ncbi:MAG: zinc ribbon domain-containing protein [Lachnospiraceae bacterium]|nr:zinc ribbon domain-containing protein [Lachnospiraceae bacterium]
MKCPSCGANLQIGDERCPFCGKDNPFAAKHRSDMNYYNREFQKTKQVVEQKTNRFTSAAVKITIIAVLVVLNILMLYLSQEGPYKIWKAQTKKDISINYEKYDTQLMEYEQEGNWNGIDEFYDEKYLHMDERFRKYSVLYYTACDYNYILHTLLSYSGEDSYMDAEYCSSRIAENLEGFYASVDRIDYNHEWYDECYEGLHGEALAQIKADMEAILMAYANLTEEEVKALPDYSESKKKSLIMEGLQR